MIFSLLLVVRNEEQYIGPLLKAALIQDFPQESYEIIVVDGNSSDRTIAIVHEFMQLHPGRINLFHNEKQTLPTGWNIGIHSAKGQYIIRIDGHGHIPVDFLTKNYRVIQKNPKISCVGGIVKTEGIGFWGKVNSYVYSHPFGVGNSMFRITSEGYEGYVDTVPYGAYSREVFQKVGYFDESLKRNEDLEFHARIRRSGGKFYLSSTIVSTYFVRNTLRGLIHKSLADGKWNMIASRRGSGVLRIRHLIPLLTVLLGMILIGLSIVHFSFLILLVIMIIIYFVILILSSYGIVEKRGKRYLLPCMVSFFLLHITRGIGSLSSFFSISYWNINKNESVGKK